MDQSVKDIVDKCIRNTYIYNDDNVSEDVVHMESNYLRMLLENRNIKSKKVKEAVQAFYKHFGYKMPIDKIM